MRDRTVAALDVTYVGPSRTARAPFFFKIPCSFVQNSAGSRPPMVSDFIPSVAYTKSTNKLPYKFSQKKKSTYNADASRVTPTPADAGRACLNKDQSLS